MASLRARRHVFAQTPNLRDNLGTLSWTPPGVIRCHLRADAELFRQRCTLATALDFFVASLHEQCVPLHFALFSERNPALVTHEVSERCSSFLPRALMFLAHPTLAADPNPALDHTRCLALQLDTSSERPLHYIDVHKQKLHTKTLPSPIPAARFKAFAGSHRPAFCCFCPVTLTCLDPTQLQKGPCNRQRHRTLVCPSHSESKTSCDPHLKGDCPNLRKNADFHCTLRQLRDPDRFENCETVAGTESMQKTVFSIF